MSRTPRSALPDGPFHVMSRAIEGGRLFFSDADRRLYLGLLQLVIERCGWKLLTFALMDTHVHLLVETTTAELSDGLWWLNWTYAERYKATYAPRFGHVFGGRPKTKPIRDDAYFLAVVRYIARNPVGVFCARPEDYPWSAHRALIGAAPPIPILARSETLAWFGAQDPVGRYQAFVTGSEPDDHLDIERWCAPGPPQDRPALETLLADGTATSILTANREWDYSIRAIRDATGLSYQGVRRALAEASRSRGLAP